MSSTKSLPDRFPLGTKYVLESRGKRVRRYIEYPDGRRTMLPMRKALSCLCMELQQVGIVPELDTPLPHDVSPNSKRRRVMA